MFMAKRVPLPSAIIPFILANLEGFEVSLEDGERIIITPRVNAPINPASVAPLATTLLSDRAVSPATERTSPPPSPRLALRPKFIYRAKDARYTPAQAKVFGLSKPRLLVYSVVHAAGAEGVGYGLIREKTKLAHGSVMQILHWLRKQKLITGAPEPERK